jgi:uncharacterized protein YhjY with autotransporter beta-barrel domain
MKTTARRFFLLNFGTVCLSTMFFFFVSTEAMGATGGDVTATNTVNFTTSTRTITHDTDVYLPADSGASSPQTVLSSLMGSYPAETRSDFALDKALADPVVHKAIVQAQQAVTGSSGTLFADPTSDLVGSSASPSYVSTDIIATNVSAATTTYIGPQTIMIGDNQSQAFTLLPGQVDYDTLITSDVYENLVYQLMGTTLTSDMQGLGLIGTTAAGEYEVVDTAPIYSLSQSALPVVEYQRTALLGVVNTATHDVNGRLFRLRSGAGGTVTAANRWEWFTAGYFGGQSQDAAGSVPGFHGHTYAGTLGGESSLSEQFKFGFAGTGLKNHTNLGLLGHMDITGWELSAYGSWTHYNFYIDGLYGFGLYADDIERNTLLGLTASASANATTHTINLNTGYNFVQKGGLVTGPMLGVKYTHGKLDAYTEKDGGTANVNVAAQPFDSLVTDLGWQLSYVMPVSSGQLTIQGHTSWQRENLSDDDAVRVGLVDSPFLLVDPAGGFVRTDSFSVNATPASAKDNYLVLGGGAKLELGKQTAILLDYEEHLFRDMSSERFGSVYVQIRF